MSRKSDQAERATAATRQFGSFRQVSSFISQPRSSFLRANASIPATTTSYEVTRKTRNVGWRPVSIHRVSQSAPKVGSRRNLQDAGPTQLSRGQACPPFSCNHPSYRMQAALRAVLSPADSRRPTAIGASAPEPLDSRSARDGLTGHDHHAFSAPRRRHRNGHLRTSL
jgi:hypothetical protein